MNKIQSLALAGLSVITLNTTAAADTNSTFNIEEFQNKVATDVVYSICEKYTSADYINIGDIKLDLPNPFNIDKFKKDAYDFSGPSFFEVDIKSGDYDYIPNDIKSNIKPDNNKKINNYYNLDSGTLIKLANKYASDINKLVLTRVKDILGCVKTYKTAEKLDLNKN